MQQLAQLKKNIGEIHDINAALAVLSWDQQTYMPKGGAEERASIISTLSQAAHEKMTADVNGKLLEELEDYRQQQDSDSDDACLLRVFKRDYDRNTKVPPEFVAEFAKVTALGNHAWESARANDDFASFCPHLEKIVELRRQYADFFKPYDHVYDPLLDEFEPGLKTADVQKIFTALRPQQVELVKAIADAPQVDNDFMHLDYDLTKQWDFGVDVITKFGYDWERGRQDKTAHPFTTTFGLGDVRITTRVYPNDLGSALFSSMHEAGHAMYEQGINRNLSRTPLATGASLAVHESQSRLWENLVGRSKPFWACFYPKLQETFSSQLGNVSLDDFYKGINRVAPSLIRVESDEATYNLHIMLRLELEIALMEGTVAVKDLPEIWNNKMDEYLGVTPASDAQGVLQDVHWSYGAIGYFSTYALGNLISAQLWQCISRDIPNVEDLITRGQFSELLQWLHTKLHIHGAKFEPQELVKRITGSNIDPAPYLAYLRAKYTDIYGL